MTKDDRRPYLDHVLAGDLDGARRHIEALMAHQSPERIVLDILAPTQVEIGRRWELNKCSVADEHVATAITDAVLAQLGAAIPSPTSNVTFAVACVEGDWHSVPARMAAELLRAQGYRVRFLGGSLPADHLERYLAELGPAGVCLSCSLPLFLPGAARSIEAAHRAGVPVMAGGRGFGRDDHAALRVGADAWSRSVATAKRQLAAWSRATPLRHATAAADTQSWSAVELAIPGLVEYSLEHLSDSSPWMAALDQTAMTRVREDLVNTLRLLAISLLVDDDRIFVEFLGWLQSVLTSRNLPPSTVEGSLSALTKALASAGQLTPRIDRLLQAAAEGWSQTMSTSKQ